MSVIQTNNNWNKINKINTREELIELLKKYKGLLADSMLNYLDSLINLEFSVIRDYIGNDDRLALSELEVYKRIAMYNIYNRALNIFNENGSGLTISGNNNGVEGLNVYADSNGRSFKLFDFDYRERTENIPIGYKTMKIGDIYLFQTIESKEKRETELQRVMSKLEKLYDKENPYSSDLHTYGGPDSQWAFEHDEKIRRYEKRFKLLDSKKELNDADKKEIEIRKKYYDLLLEDYGLTNKDFDENLHSNEETKLHKTLVKRMPNINIINSNKYI